MIARFIYASRPGSIDRSLGSINRKSGPRRFLQNSNLALVCFKTFRVFYFALGINGKSWPRFNVANIAVCINLLWDLWGAFLYTSLGFSWRRCYLHLDDQFSCCHWNLKKHKRVCLFLLENPRKESVVLELARGHVSKFYWWVVIRSRVWGLVNLIVWTSILSR